jgi:mRNA-degrading endonuclease RelE of RelBE toxin-antitoxin system
MAYQITITEEAESHCAREQRLLKAAIQARLVHQPITETNAIKRLRPNPLAEFELRVHDLRVLYNVEESEVVLLVVGRKVGNKLVVKGQDFYGHQNNPVQPPGGGSEKDA